MAVDFIGYRRNRMDYEDPGPSPNNPSLSMVIEEAEAAVGLKTSMEHLIHILSSSSQKEDSDMTKKRTLTGHARFRRGVSSSVPENKQSVDHTTNKGTKECDDDSMSISMSMPSSSITTNTTTAGGVGEGSVSNGIGIGKQQQGSPASAPAPWSAAKPPLAATNRPRKRPSEAAVYSHHSAGHSNGHNHCHCHSKKRKHDVKRRIKIKVASTYMEIPPDEYSWKKYGQKPIQGSPHHRGYYRCSSARGCPGRKTVERSHHDPTILIVTYGGEHRHSSNFFPLPS